MKIPDHNKNLVELKNVTFSYVPGHEVLKNITLDIHSGDFLGVIGPNGGGKSTLIKLILGLLTPDSGTIKSFFTSVGYVAQKATDIDAKFPVTVRDVVSMGLYSRRGLFKPLNRSDQHTVSQALDQVNMKEFKNQLIGNLSGGQQQRVFIARALATQSQLIVLDEPTSGVDESSQDEFYDLLKRLNQELGITLVLISHDTDVVTHEATEVVAINKTVVYYGTSEKFKKEEHHDKLYSKDLKFIHHHG